ncbi:hypothetical protein IFO70_33520 [Phormidium tenue FACHB-886]|nr:hypothetical protein [Phormidium tenue FACHB-886]
MPVSEVQRIFGNLPENPFSLAADAELTENAPSGWTAIEAGHEPNTPTHPLLWSNPDIIGLNEDISRMEDRIDRDLATLQENAECLKNEIDRHIDALKFELEQAQDRIETLEDQLDQRSIVPFYQRPHRLVEALRITAVLTLSIGAIVFIGAGLSGTPEQKDDLALSGAILATVGVFAATTGYNLD